MRRRLIATAVLFGASMAVGAGTAHANEPIKQAAHVIIDTAKALVPSWDSSYCMTEDSTGCFWDAQLQGNGKGQSYWIDAWGVVQPANYVRK